MRLPSRIFYVCFVLFCESILSVPHTPHTTQFISAMKTLAMRSVALNFHVKLMKKEDHQEEKK